MIESTDNSELRRTMKTENSRALFYKKPIKKYNYRLELDEETPQEIRRQELLQRQKKNREEIFNNSRGIVEEVLSTYEDDADDELEEMEVDRQRSRHAKNHKYRKNNVMMSEWMLEVPTDFIEKWVMVPCPVGRRTILLASKGSTRAYNKHGRKVAKFQSALPGGNLQDYYHKFTLLDCIWHPTEKIYYALDVVAWSNQVFMDCEADFRFYWLHSKLKESDEFREQNTQNNKFPILSLPYITCDADISEFLANLTNFPTVDGLLFYHRDGFYTRGFTPLVTWLKPFMISEMLGITVPESYEEKPEGYIDIKHYLASSGRKKRKNNLDSTMEFKTIED